jgi:hypothetical protein
LLRRGITPTHTCLACLIRDAQYRVRSAIKEFLKRASEIGHRPDLADSTIKARWSDPRNRAKLFAVDRLLTKADLQPFG